MNPDDLPPAWREWYEERAAIREYDGKQTRDVAEREAMNETMRAMGLTPTSAAGSSDFTGDLPGRGF